MAGTCDTAMPATILAILTLHRGRFLLRRGFFVTIAVGTAAAGQHHLRIDLLRHAGHEAGHVLEGEAVAKCDLDGVVNIAAYLEHSQPVALEHRAALLG